MNDKSNEKICKICNEDQSKYCCPRCNILYCSLTCYKSEKHTQCSEGFYRELVLQELSSRDNDSNHESKKKMQEILTRLNTNDEMIQADAEQELGNILKQAIDDDLSDNSDDEMTTDLAERLTGIDLNNADLVWDLLTNDEKLEFEGLLNSGDVTNFVPEWIPWWMYKKEKKLIENLSETKVNEYKKNCPAHLVNTKPLHDISKVPPAACVKFNLINVLGAYAYTARLFNGEHQESALESSNCLVAIATNINSNQNFEEVDIALESVGQLCLKYEFLECDRETILTMKKDVQLIMEGPEDSELSFYIISALSDIYKLFKSAQNSSQPKNKLNPSITKFSKKFVEHNSEDFPTVPKNKLRVYVKKVEYYLSFVLSNEYFNCMSI